MHTYTLTLTTLSPELFACLQTEVPKLLTALEHTAKAPEDKRAIAFVIHNMKTGQGKTDA